MIEKYKFASSDPVIASNAQAAKLLASTSAADSLSSASWQSKAASLEILHGTKIEQSWKRFFVAKLTGTTFRTKNIDSLQTVGGRVDIKHLELPSKSSANAPDCLHCVTAQRRPESLQPYKRSIMTDHTCRSISSAFIAHILQSATRVKRGIVLDWTERIALPPRLKPISYLLLCSPFISVKLCIRRCRRYTGSAGRVSSLVTVPTDPFTRPTVPFLSEWAKCQHGNTQNGGTVLPIANLMANSKSERTDSYSRFQVTIRLARLVSLRYSRVTDRRTDGQRGQLL